jgi:hypothetical protein
VIDAISNAIDAIDNAAAFIKTFGHYPLTTESLRQAVEGLQSLQNRGEADHDALNDLWACAESGYSLDDLKAKIKMYLDASPQPVVPEVRVLSRDEARLALWRAIQEVVVGNPTDDKLILENLYKSGVWLCLLSAGKETDK